MAAPRTLSTADERREEILEAAEHVFAARGLHGTPTMEIAKAAGISQAYLFRLFPTKAELFTALVERCNRRIERTFVDAAAAAREAGAPVMAAMGLAYVGLLADRRLLLNQLHAHAACDDPAIRDQMRRGFARLVEIVERETGAEPQEVRNFFAHGMLLNVLAAMQAREVDEHWAQVLNPAHDVDDCR
ncbi:MAG: Transcriptional regulator, AcrR family [uncultured Solirubrobacteraceae bacterium]|uniref:Transcriptional regulator, AcrR family n=1 Tax=uncultured Solirubrobacteraceae bacterium TaxID=1162706 RepID=A0A6J4TJQ4_9ACTN|nr:MAG: Transcriptional regulator, AcrR family [uncultured Solirubrobacteraceae bacterium]